MQQEDIDNSFARDIDAIMLDAAEKHLADVLRDEAVCKGFARFLEHVVPSLAALLVEVAADEAVAVGVAADRLEQAATLETDIEEEEAEAAAVEADAKEASDEEKDAAFLAEMEHALYYWKSVRKLIPCADPYNHRDSRWTYRIDRGYDDVDTYFTATADKLYVSALSNIDTAAPEYQQEFDRKNLDWGIAANTSTRLTLAAMARVQQWHHRKYGWYGR